MFYCLTTILSIIFYNSLICLSFEIEIFYFQTVPGTKHHRFIFTLTFSAIPSFFRHQKDSGRQSSYKGENLYNVSCILAFYYVTFQYGCYNIVFKKIYFFCPQKFEKTAPRSCILMAVGRGFFSAQNSQEFLFPFYKFFCPTISGRISASQ